MSSFHIIKDVVAVGLILLAAGWIVTTETRTSVEYMIYRSLLAICYVLAALVVVLM